MKILAFLSLLIGVSAAAQQPGITLGAATQHVVTLSWGVPQPAGTWQGCTTSSPCTYQVFALRGQSCPATVIGSPGWQFVGGSSTTTLKDSTEQAGTIVSYVAYTLQAGSQSGPSNCITVTVPNNPGAATNLQQQ
jgi:hypothetical protein